MCQRSCVSMPKIRYDGAHIQMVDTPKDVFARASQSSRPKYLSYLEACARHHITCSRCESRAPHRLPPQDSVVQILSCTGRVLRESVLWVSCDPIVRGCGQTPTAPPVDAVKHHIQKILYFSNTHSCGRNVYPHVSGDLCPLVRLAPHRLMFPHRSGDLDDVEGAGLQKSKAFQRDLLHQSRRSKDQKWEVGQSLLA